MFAESEVTVRKKYRNDFKILFSGIDQTGKCPLRSMKRFPCVKLNLRMEK